MLEFVAIFNLISIFTIILLYIIKLIVDYNNNIGNDK